MLLLHRFPRLTLALSIIAAAGACGGGDVTVPPTTGTLEITTSTSGTEQDADGYSVQIDAGAPRAIGAAATLTTSDITPGNHTLQLGEVAANCTVSGDNPRTVSVTAGETTTISFAVTCNATAGIIRVSVTTSGSPTDPDGYVAKLDGGDPGLAIATGGSVSFTNVPAGSHTVALTGLAANCSVTDGPSQNITVTAGEASDLGFVVTCASTTGSIQLTTNTTGSSLDADGYALNLDGGASQAIGLNETRSLEGLAVGTHTITLSGIASNCHLDGDNPRVIEVVRGSTTVAFNLNCLGANALIAFTSNALLGPGPSIFVVSLDGTGLRNLSPDGAAEVNPRWSPDGSKILFSKSEGLYVMDADGGSRVKLADGRTGISGHRWSPDGRMIAYVDERLGVEDPLDFSYDLWVMQADGTGKVKVAEQADNISWSPDGRIAYRKLLALGVTQLRIVNADGTGDVLLTNRRTLSLAWSPDGTRIAFVAIGSVFGSVVDLILINPDGTGEVNLTRGLSFDFEPTWSPDGSRIALSTAPVGGSGPEDVALINRDGTGRTNLTSNPGVDLSFDFEPTWSPDGSKIAYIRAENGDEEIYVMNADGTGKTNVSNRPDDDESTPDWNGQGATVGSRQNALSTWLRAPGLEAVGPH